MNDDQQHSRQKPSAPIDWNEMHHRLATVQTTLERGWTLSPEEQKKILQARAQALAQEPIETAAEEQIEVIEFRLADELYGLESFYVREVYPMKELTPLPCTPSFVLGIINVRGQILTVIDIKKFFGLPEKGLTDLNKVIVIRNDAMQLGILADAILGVRSIPLDALQPSLPTLTGIRAEYLKGVTKERLVILAGEKILADQKIIVNEEVEG